MSFFSSYPRFVASAGARSRCALRPTVLACLATWAAPAVLAQPSAVVVAQNARAPSLSETVITATRSEQPLSDLVADVSILDRQAIENSGASGLAALLARLPGIEISRNGGQAGVTSVFLRGSESRFTAVYLDGVRIDSQATGGVQWEQIPLSQVERIEVLRGPAAAVYGSDAVGGVVQLFTRKGEGASAPYVGVGLGSRGTRKLEAGVSGALGAEGALDYAVGLARETSDGFDAKVSGVHDPDRDDYQRTSGHARLGLRINAMHRLDGTLVASRLESGYDNFSYVPTRPVDDRNTSRLRTAGLSWTARWTPAYTTRVALTDADSRYETSPSPYLTRTQLRGYLWDNEWRLGAHRWNLALERREDHLRNAPIDQGRSQDALALGYGLRSGRHTVQLNLRHDSDSEFGGKSTGSAAYGYDLAAGWRMTASVGTAFRAPTLYQRFSEYGVATLQPESSRNAELGVRWAQDNSSFSAVAYRNRLTQLISFAGAGACASPFGCYANTARAQYEGVTLAASYRWAGVQWHGSLDFQNPRDLDTGRQLARRAKRHAKLGAESQWAGWQLGSEVVASGSRFDNASGTAVLGGYTVVNVYASTRVAQDFTLLARLDNVTDKAYELARTYATPGRSVYVGLQWSPR